jgi:glucokinase
MYEVGSAIGVDLGGTWMRATLVHADGRRPRIIRQETGKGRPSGAIVSDIAKLVREIQRSAGSDSLPIGMAVPTTLAADGSLDPCNNLPNMGGYQLGRVLGQRLEHRVHLENDANCYALGEWHAGAGQGCCLLVCLTLGTGIGLGIVYRGEILSGAHGRAGEIWRSPLNLSALSEEPGRLEQIVSGTGLEQLFTQRAGRRANGEEVAALARSNVPEARSVFAELGTTLGRAIRWISDLLDPDRIILGGAVAESMELFSAPMVEACACSPDLVVKSRLGDLAPLLGAARIALRCEGA